MTRWKTASKGLEQRKKEQPAPPGEVEMSAGGKEEARSSGPLPRRELNLSAARCNGSEPCEAPDIAHAELGRMCSHISQASAHNLALSKCVRAVRPSRARCDSEF